MISRLFLYYHTLANNKGTGKVGQRAWFYFPLFYFFESNIDGRVSREQLDMISAIGLVAIFPHFAVEVL